MSFGVWTDDRARRFLRDMFDAAVASANPAQVLARHLPPRPQGRCVVVGAGKAAGSMAAAVEAAWPDVSLSGVVVAPVGYGVRLQRIRMLEAGHPIPDANSEAAAREMLAAVGGLGPDDLVLALISGGGSSTLTLPAPGLTLADKQAVNRLLLASGLDIRTMNTVRKRLSAIKGGKLALAAAPAKVVTLGVSDIPGDDPTAIASGPTMPDHGAEVDLSDVVERLGAGLPPNVVRRLLAPGTPAGPMAVDFRLITTPALALAAAAHIAEQHGVRPVILGDNLEGESRDLGAQMADVARRAVDRPTVLLSGGETSVTLSGGGAPGQGGRNTEFLLALVSGLGGLAGVWALACDTDGADGASEAAGAVAGPDTLRRAAAIGLEAAGHLDDHDSGGFFGALGDLVQTGPTLTNVNDFRAILITPPGRP